MNKPEQTSSSLFEISDSGNNGIIIHLKRRLDMTTAAPALKYLNGIIKEKSPASVVADMKDVSYFDDFGALVLFELKKAAEAVNGTFSVIHTGDNTKAILKAVNFDSHQDCAVPKPKRSYHILVRLGDSIITETTGLNKMIAFAGAVVLACIYIIRHPGSFRFDDAVTNIEKTGADAVPIVALISFLLGLIMAFMSAMQLKHFGANIYVASLVALAMVSELSPLMTSIIVAGRSGSSYAAEIGTMKISEEIDALISMGFDPTLFLVMPRIAALVIVVPLLTFFANFFSITGGLVIGVTMLDLTMGTYIHQTIAALDLFEVFWGIFKSAVFAGLIAWISCFRGLQAKGGADAVGNAATSAVVSSLFLIILFDSIFAVIRSYW